MSTPLALVYRLWLPLVLSACILALAVGAGASPSILPVFLLALAGALLLGHAWVTREIITPLRNIVAVSQQQLQRSQRTPAARSPSRRTDGQVVSISQIAQELQTQFAELNRQVYHDPLTRLPNRALFKESLERALSPAHQTSSDVAVMFLDLDNFKVINDSLGHPAGDQLLIAVADRLRECLRSQDIGARLGGDEFTVLLPDVAGVSDATYVAQRIEQRLQAPFRLAGHDVFVSASIGIAIGAPGRDRPSSLLRDADLALYQAKSRGKACYAVFDSSLMLHAMERLELETDLRQAVLRGEFQVYYQPIVSLESGEIIEVEALVRWKHPRRGLVAPKNFIPLAEETGLIVPIGQWVLAEAARQVRVCQLQYPRQQPLVLNVNFSAREFQNLKLPNEVERILYKNRLDPSNLKIEMTESAIMDDSGATLNTLQQLKQMNIKLALDDFGMGYSSMSYLKRFPFDVLKIDGSFVEQLEHDARDMAILRAIITMAKTLNLGVTAEGIETKQQLGLLRGLECDLGQGYFFARPLTDYGLRKLLKGEAEALNRKIHPVVEPVRLALPGRVRTAS